jgi:hypothetical protein
MNEEIKRYVGAAGTVMDIDKLSQYPQSFNLSQNYPNPFNPSTSIDYDVENGGQVELAIYDLTGKQIRTLVSDFQSVGRKVVQWNGTNDVGIEVSSGIYFYQIQVNGYSEMKKMMFLK